MKVVEKKLTLEEGLKKEWLITNGIGGFASSTVIGANTRKYHGLLVAPIEPPARRYLILSKVDESIELDGKKYELYTNVCKNYISKGYKLQTGFEKVYVPQFTYKVEDTEIKKEICMEYGKNTVGILYKVKNGKQKAKLTLAPILNYRDFHCMNTNHTFDLRQDVKENKVKVIVDNNISHPIYMKVNNSKYYKHDNDIFWNMFYLEEEKRGFYPEENHSVPGVFEIEIEPNEQKEISFVCSFEENIDEINVKDLIKNEEKRLKDTFEISNLVEEGQDKDTIKKNELIKNFLIAIDNFIVYRPSFRLHTIIAGYPWFLDWGRDTLISFEGLLLITNKFDIAREVLLTSVRDIKYGLVPNGYSGFDNRPLYNSADASLLLFEQIKKYLKYTNDFEFVEKNLYSKLPNIIENYIKGIDVDDNNIYLDSDYLLVSGTENTQNTWMDAKYEGVAITPRNGKTVELNSLWYNALMIMSELEERFGTSENVKKYQKLAKKCKEEFNLRFYNARRKCLYDVLGDKKIRPNQLFSLSLTYPIIEPNSEMATNIIETAKKKLLNNYGLKSLAKGEENYVEVYEGDGKQRDKSYHQGITWTWLLGLYYNAMKNRIKSEKKKKEKVLLEEELEEFRNKVTKTFTKDMYEDGCIGSISEIYDTKKPQLPKGCIAQAWSVAEVFRIILGK